ncbi:uncharacterized protein LOC106647571 [Copidosoma floridanum]|uniref:uncharacterized protein LOC106647571 n=1 Tax=Copidosoma floridanum TaxID=29053 RepID=UPI0006C966B1|nr:uncharacterized protein LOC106647571 [Copidosoma floridanum]
MANTYGTGYPSLAGYQAPPGYQQYETDEYKRQPAYAPPPAPEGYVQHVMYPQPVLPPPPPQPQPRPNVVFVHNTRSSEGCICMCCRAIFKIIWTIIVFLLIVILVIVAVVFIKQYLIK